MTARPFTRLTKPLMRVFADRQAVNRWFRFEGPAEGDVVTVQFDPIHSVFEADGISMTAPAPIAWIMLSDVMAIAPDRGTVIDSLFDEADRLEIAGRRYCAESCRLVAHDLLEVVLREEL